jgi:hypothetical protein
MSLEVSKRRMQRDGNNQNEDAELNVVFYSFR